MYYIPGDYIIHIVIMIYSFYIQILIIEGETGSGKTTQIPQYLYEAVGYYSVCENFQGVIFLTPRVKNTVN